MEWEVVSLPRVGAAAGLNYQLPGGERTRIGSLAFRLGCSGGGAARLAVVEINDGTGEIFFGVAAPATHASGQVVTYSFAPDVPAFGSAATFFMGGPMPSAWMPTNTTLSIVVVNAGASDVLSHGRLLVGQYPVIESAEA